MRNENEDEDDVMKDPRDKSTVDGFADLLKGLDDQPAIEAEEAPARPGVALSDLAQLLDHVARQNGLKRPVGRPPQGERALSPAEKQKAYRDRKRAEKAEAAARLEAIARGEKVTSTIIDLTTDFSDLLRRE